MTQTCDACGKHYGYDELEAIDMTGLVPNKVSLCRACANRWNDIAERSNPYTHAQLYEQFKQERQALH